MLHLQRNYYRYIIHTKDRASKCNNIFNNFDEYIKDRRPFESNCEF